MPKSIASSNAWQAPLPHNDTSLEVRIPISACDHYFNRIRLIAESIREFYPRAIVRVSVSADREPFDIERELAWSAPLGVRWSWVEPAAFTVWQGTQMPYVATITERYRPPFFAEHVLMLDADVLPMRPFDELFSRDTALLGMMAHATPFGVEHHDRWRDLFVKYALAEPDFAHEHSGWQAMVTNERFRYSPPYFNSGVVLARATVLERFYEHYAAALDFVLNCMDTYFFDQIAITLALAKSGLPYDLLTLPYNFPNQPNFDARYPKELAEARFIHFLRTDIVGREKDFETEETMAHLVARTDLKGSNEALRRRVADLLAAR